MNKKIRFLILAFQLVSFVIAFMIGIVVITIKQISWGYSMAYFVLITLITMIVIIANVINYKNKK